MQTILVLAVLAVVLITTSSSYAFVPQSHSHSSSLVETNSKFELPVHRSLSELAFDRIKAELGSVSEARRAESDEQNQAFRHFKGTSSSSDSDSVSVSQSDDDSDKEDVKKSSIFSKLKSVYHSLSAKTLMAAGKGVDFLLGKPSEAQSTLDKSETLEELVHRVNLRLGVTYPDVPLPGNNPISSDNSLREISVKLFTARHASSLSLSGAEAMASSHEGDRQYWHAMTADKSPVTNHQVYSAIKVNLRELYTQSRRATDEQRWWWYGRMLHCIQDSYSDAHAARDLQNENLPITFFENYAMQKMKLHSLSDSSPDADDEELAEAKAKSGTKDEETDRIKLLSKLNQRKKKLYNMAQNKTAEFLRIVWKNRGTNGRKNAPNVWPEIKEFLDTVFQFADTYADFDTSVTGGSLPEYAVDEKHSRRRDWYEQSSRHHSAITAPKLGGVFTRGIRSMQLRRKELPGVHGYSTEVFNRPATLSVDPRVTSSSLLHLRRIVARNLASGDTFGSNEVFIVVKTDSERGRYQTEVAVPHKLRTHDSDEDVFNMEHTLYEHAFLGHGKVKFYAYDSDRVVGVPTEAESNLIGEGEAKLSDFKPTIDDDHPPTVMVKMYLDGERHGSLLVTAKSEVVGARGEAVANKGRGKK
jgi:hypothetical protein